MGRKVWGCFADKRVGGHAHAYDNGSQGRLKRPNPRNANGHRRRELRKRVASLGLPCGICGKPIDYSLPPGHPMSYELDEVVPVSLGGDPLDPRNVRPAHRICNERRGNRAAKQSRSSGLPQSRSW